MSSVPCGSMSPSPSWGDIFAERLRSVKIVAHQHTPCPVNELLTKTRERVIMSRYTSVPVCLRIVRGQTAMEGLPTIRDDSYVPLREQVYEVLREAILTGRLKPGERLAEGKMCRVLGVSRSPLREALRRLQAEGLVNFLPRQGTVVSEISQRDVLDLFTVREVLEGLAAALAAEVITSEDLSTLEEICRSMEQPIQAHNSVAVDDLNAQFHGLIIGATGNNWLVSLTNLFRMHVRRIYCCSTKLPERAPQSLREHREILEALRNRDAEAAERLARHHVRQAKEAILWGEAVD